MPYYENDMFGDGSLLLTLQQDLVNSKSGAKQTRVATSTEATYTTMPIASISWTEDPTVQSDRSPFQRRARFHKAGIQLRGTIEFSENLSLWEGIAKGCEIVTLKYGDYIVYQFDTSNKHIDRTGTSITTKLKTIASADIVTGTTGAWNPGAIASGKVFLPRTDPIFYMILRLKPNTPHGKTYTFNEVMFGQVTPNLGRGGHSIEFYASWLDSYQNLQAV